jgi:hypothetical protein
MTNLVFTRGGGGGGLETSAGYFSPTWGWGPLLHFNVAQAGQQTTDQGVGTMGHPALLQNRGEKGTGDRGLTLSEIWVAW